MIERRWEMANSLDRMREDYGRNSDDWYPLLMSRDPSLSTKEGVASHHFAMFPQRNCNRIAYYRYSFMLTELRAVGKASNQRGYCFQTASNC